MKNGYHSELSHLLRQLAKLPASIEIIPKCEMALQLIKDATDRLRRRVVEENGKNTRTTIDLYRNIIPAIYAEYIFFASVHNIETRKPPAGYTTELLEEERQKIHFFYTANSDFILYYKSGKQHLDLAYFALSYWRAEMHIDTLPYPADDPLYNPYTYKAAVFLAYQRLAAYIETLKTKNSAPGPRTDVYWSRSKTDLIELAYALYAGQVFNNGKATLSQIATMLENMLGVDLGNTSLRFQEILRRKDSTAFLAGLKERLENYMNNLHRKKN